METFNPIPYEYYEILTEAREQGKSGKIHYFDADEQVEEANGKIIDWKGSTDGEYLNLDSGQSVRLDRIITIYGRPGPSYDRYDAYANACLDCMGGMD